MVPHLSRPRLLLLCGGESAEHEVSLASARSVLEAAAGRLEVTALVIDRSVRLLDSQASLRALEAGQAPAGSGSAGLSAGVSDREPHDVVFPLLHGPNGEDGSVQGLLRLTGLPFVGSDIAGSAAAMDKLMMKAVLAAAGLPQVAWQPVLLGEWLTDRTAVLDRLSDWTWPLFVKPANLGSSVGISRVTDRASLEAGLELAFSHDRRVIVEEGVNAPRELEVAVLGNDRPEASPVGEIRFDSAFYDYETKYGEGRAELIIPAELPTELADRCRDLALQAFRQLDLAGLARVDFFLTEGGQLLLNEVNTMPGFTRTSMYPRLWQAGGISYPELIERLVSLALERHALRRPAGTSSR